MVNLINETAAGETKVNYIDANKPLKLHLDYHTI